MKQQPQTMESMCIIFQQNQIIQQNVQAQDQFLGLLQEKIFDYDATEGSVLLKSIVKSCDLLVQLREPSTQISTSLGITYQYLQQNLKITLLSLELQNIFCKNKNQGLEIFFALLAGFKRQDKILEETKKILQDTLIYIKVFANEYYENSAYYKIDQQKWDHFKEMLNYFSQEEQQWILKNLTYILLDISQHWENISEKKLPNKLNKKTEVQTQQESLGMSTQSSDYFAQSNEYFDVSDEFYDYAQIPINQYALINLDKNIFDHIDICSISSFKINDNKQQGVSIYLYTQITQLIFKKFEKMFQKQMIKENRKINNICFLLMPKRSESDVNHLSEFLRDAFNDIIVSEVEKQNQQNDMNQINKKKFNEETFKKFAGQQSTIAEVREYFNTDKKFDYFTYQGKYYEFKHLEKDNRVIIPEQWQQQIINANLQTYPLISNDQNAPKEEVLLNTQQQQDIIRSIDSQLKQASENGQNSIQIPDELQIQLLQLSNKSYYTLIPNKSILSAVEYVNSFIQNIKNFKMEDSSAIWKDPHYLQPARNIIITQKQE